MPTGKGPTRANNLLVPPGLGETEDAALGARINIILNWFEELKERVPTGR